MQNSEELLHQIKAYKPQSDISRMKEFIQSDLYFDFRNEVMARILYMQGTLSSVVINNTRDDLMRTQGGLIALELVLNIFENLLSNKESDLLNEEKNDEEDL